MLPVWSSHLHLPSRAQQQSKCSNMGTWSGRVSVSPHKSTQSLSAALFAPFWAPALLLKHCWNSSKSSHCRGCRWNSTSSSIFLITLCRETTSSWGSYFYIDLWLCSVLPLQLKNPTHARSQFQSLCTLQINPNISPFYFLISSSFLSSSPCRWLYFTVTSLMLHRNFPQNMPGEDILYRRTGHLVRDPNFKKYKLTSNECLLYWKLYNYFFQSLSRLSREISQFSSQISVKSNNASWKHFANYGG